MLFLKFSFLHCFSNAYLVSMNDCNENFKHMYSWLSSLVSWLNSGKSGV